MRYAVHQPNYIPWCGYFSKMKRSDVFVFLDDAQMPGGQSYVYRVQICGMAGKQWLSVPKSFKLGERCSEVKFANPRWGDKHLKTFQATYHKSPFFQEIMTWIEPFYRDPGSLLADFNIKMNSAIAEYLGLKCRFAISSQLHPEGTSDDRLISIGKNLGGSIYVSGKGGQNYQSPEKFASAGIDLEVHEYQPVPYPQNHGDFVPGVSILDALFNLGRATIDIL